MAAYIVKACKESSQLLQLSTLAVDWFIFLNFLFYFYFYYYYHYHLFFGCSGWYAGILVPWPGIKFMPPAVEAWSLNHWTSREIPDSWFLFFYTTTQLFLIICIHMFNTCLEINELRGSKRRTNEFFSQHKPVTKWSRRVSFHSGNFWVLFLINLTT